MNDVINGKKQNKIETDETDEMNTQPEHYMAFAYITSLLQYYIDFQFIVVVVNLLIFVFVFGSVLFFVGIGKCFRYLLSTHTDFYWHNSRPPPCMLKKLGEGIEREEIESGRK